MASSPTQRTLAYFRRRGYIAAITERWQAFPNPKPGGPPGVRIDLFGWIDLIAITDGQIIGIQTTSQSNQAARIAKAQALPEFQQWLRAGGLAYFIGWRKVGAVGKRKTWQPRIVQVGLDFREEVIELDA